MFFWNSLGFSGIQRMLAISSLVPLVLHLEDWNAKVGSQGIPGTTGKFGLGVQNEAGQRLAEFLSREHTGHSKPPLPTTQETALHMDITRWSTPKSDRSYSLQPKTEKLYTVSKRRPGADCGSDHELLLPNSD